MLGLARRRIVELCIGLTVITEISSRQHGGLNNSIFHLLPLEIQSDFVWCHLLTDERRRLCEVSRSCNDLYHRLYPLEYPKRQALMNVFPMISRCCFETHSSGLLIRGSYLSELERRISILLVLHQSLTEEDDIRSIAKIVVRITEIAVSEHQHLGATSTLCNCCSIRWPTLQIMSRPN